MEDFTGQQVGQYELKRKIGSGGFAEVYLGVHIHLKSQAAIKILNQAAHLQAGDIDQFYKEARIISSLRHQHIVRR